MLLPLEVLLLVVVSGAASSVLTWFLMAQSVAEAEAWVREAAAASGRAPAVAASEWDDAAPTRPSRVAS
jgi:hypothetical protein